MVVFVNHKTGESVKMSNVEYKSHVNHCCIHHGCKYGDDNCPVVLGRDKQSYPCEECDIKHSSYIDYDSFPEGMGLYAGSTQPFDTNMFKKTLDSLEKMIVSTCIIKENMLEAIKVVFIKPIFENDFPERGMKAWLTAIDKSESNSCWELFFDFTEFESENDKYLKANYYDDNSNPTLTAKEAGMYSNKYSVYFGDLDTKKFGTFEEQIKEYLMVV